MHSQESKMSGKVRKLLGDGREKWGVSRFGWRTIRDDGLNSVRKGEENNYKEEKSVEKGSREI